MHSRNCKFSSYSVVKFDCHLDKPRAIMASRIFIFCVGTVSQLGVSSVIFNNCWKTKLAGRQFVKTESKQAKWEQVLAIVETKYPKSKSTAINTSADIIFSLHSVAVFHSYRFLAGVFFDQTCCCWWLLFLSSGAVRKAPYSAEFPLLKTPRN